MNANQRRPGFRLPWSSEQEGGEIAEGAPSSEPQFEAPEASIEATTPTPAVTDAPTERATASDETSARPPTAPDAGPTPASPVDAPEPFLRDLVAAMRRVADDAREAGLAELRTQADETVGQLEHVAEQRRAELRDRAEADIAGVGEWAKAEAERIRREAESRVAARRAQLDEQLAAENRRIEVEGRALRERVAEYERELAAYHAQLADIHDPAAFAAAAKRMPKPPPLTAAPSAPATATDTAVGPVVTAPHNGAGQVRPSSVPAETVAIHPAEEEVLAGRLAELDAELEIEAATPDAGAAPAQSAASVEEPTTTDVVVKGLGSFGAITGFRQSLAGVAGIDGVALSLGSSGEFIFRTTHRPSVDVGAAITALEADGARVERRSDGTLAVTLERAR